MPASDSPYRRRPAAAELRGRGAQAPAVIGGGLIGIEAVEVCLAAGLRPRFFVREEWFWPMAIDARESGWICARLRDHGVDVQLEHEVEAVDGEGGLITGVRTDRGAFACDLAVVAIGVVPNTGFLSGSGIDLHPQGGVLVDRGLSTSAPDVYAAGDCALLPFPDGSRRPEQLWYTARDQGRVAGRRLLGEEAEYARGEPYNSAKLMDMEFTTAGRVGEGMPGEREWFFEERTDVRSTVRIVTRGDRVVGFNLLGRRYDHSLLLEWIEAGRSLAWVLDHLPLASFDSEWVPPLSIPPSERARPALAMEG